MKKLLKLVFNLHLVFTHCDLSSHIHIFMTLHYLCTIMFNVLIHSIYVLPGELKVLTQSTFCFAFCDMTKT